MPFVCPACERVTLDIVASVDLGPDDYDDDRKVQRIRCCSCAWRGVAYYTAERRGSDESWRHHGYRVTPTQLAVVDAWFEAGDGRAKIDGVSDLVSTESWFRLELR